MPKKLVTFVAGWLNEKLHPEFSKWLAPVKSDPYQAYCTLCRKAFNIGSMGAQALTSHMKSATHAKATKAAGGQRSVASLFCPGTSTSTDKPAENEPTTEVPQTVQSGLRVKDETVKAEVIWCLKTVTSHFSFRSAANLNKLFKAMFPDSEVAQSFALGRDKIAYTLVYGVGPSFKKDLVRKVLMCSEFTICFDEALNHVAQKGQMDILVRFWDSESQNACTRYFTSVFLQRASAEHLVNSFKEGLNELPLPKMLQISMDGPSVNHKFYRDIKKDVETGPDDPCLVDMGTCSLHVVNGAFQAGHKASLWDINGFLRNLYYMFKDCPARRAQYYEITDSDMWPKKFCVIRWTENSGVADRALEMVPHLRKWVKDVHPKPTSQVFDCLSKHLSNPALEARLEFFKSLALLLEPFLTAFQSDKPMLPFLYEQLDGVLRTLMGKFIKKNVLDDAKTSSKLLALDLTPKSDALLAKPNVGFGASKRLGNPKISQVQNVAFYSECRVFYRTLAAKLIERCPLSYKIVRAASALSPSVIIGRPETAQSRMQSLLEVLVGCNRLLPAVADKAKQEFQAMVHFPEFQQPLKDFAWEKDRLDNLYYGLIGRIGDYGAIWVVTKMVLIMSHGNATVESGFSVNTDMLVENLKNDSLVALRMVYDGIKSYGGPLSVPLTPELMKFVRSARGRYREALEHAKTKAKDPTVREEMKRQAESQMNDLQAKKMALQADAIAQERKINKEMAILQKQISK